MKYYLAFIRNNKRKDIFRVNLGLIDKRFNSDNNLRALCDFTRSFENEYELKSFLFKLNPNLIIYENSKLVIIDSKNVPIERVPFQMDSKYLLFENLIDIIISNLSNQEFVEEFLKYFKGKKKGMASQSFELREMLGSNCSKELIRNKILALFDKLFYDNKKFNYREFYRFAMFVCELLKRVKNNVYEREISEVEQFEKEWLEERALTLKKKKKNS